MTPEKIEWKRDVPVRYEADVAVIGGGIAGVSAACAAARDGVSVILVERFAVTGGVLTSGGVGNWSGDIEGQGEVFEAILSGLRAFKAMDDARERDARNDVKVFDHEILAVVLQELLLKRGVKLLLHTRFVDVRVNKNQRITECLVCGASGPEAVRARQWIDCTGEGQVAHLAGFPTMKGRSPDGLQLPMSMMFFVREGKEAGEPQIPEGWFEAIRDKDDLPMTSPWPNGPGGRAIKIKIPMFDSTDTEKLTDAEVRARRRMMEVLDYFQRVEKKPWRFDHASPIIGIREGRRIVGDYVLTVDDLRAGRTFEDAVARGTFYLDGHRPDDDKRTYILPKDELDVPPYQIPLRSLVAKYGENVMMAGRCFSADQLALSSARVAPTGSMMGQAAGAAAVLCVKGGCDPRGLDYGDVRAVVEKHGARLEV